MPDTKDIQPLVLIADDDATTLLLMGAVLEENGFWVVTAADGQEALERYEGRAPDLVILDLGMPRLGGIEVCQRLRTDDSSIPIMISTSKDDLASIDLAFGGGATDFVTKPDNWPLLTRRVQYLLKSSQAMIELEQTSKYKTEFLHNMSHELRTPMNDVLGMIELMQTTSLSLEQQGYCTTVASSGKALLRIIGNILDFSKVEAGEMTFENIDFFLDDTIQETCDIMSPLAFDEEVDLLASIAADCPDQVHGDLERLQQILANLLSNAIKFTDAGHVKLAVTRTAAEIVHVTVSDTGIGLSSAAQAQVFEPFTQADGSTTRMFGGTGLGLTIARRLAEGMGGRISLTGEEGMGTTFTVALPWSQARYAGPTARPSGRALICGRTDQIAMYRLALPGHEICGATDDLDHEGPFDCIVCSDPAIFTRHLDLTTQTKLIYAQDAQHRNVACPRPDVQTGSRSTSARLHAATAGPTNQ